MGRCCIFARCVYSSESSLEWRGAVNVYFEFVNSIGNFKGVKID